MLNYVTEHSMRRDGRNNYKQLVRIVLHAVFVHDLLRLYRNDKSIPRLTVRRFYFRANYNLTETLLRWIACRPIKTNFVRLLFSFWRVTGYPMLDTSYSTSIHDGVRFFLNFWNRVELSGNVTCPVRSVRFYKWRSRRTRVTKRIVTGRLWKPTRNQSRLGTTVIKNQKENV